MVDWLYISSKLLVVGTQANPRPIYCPPGDTRSKYGMSRMFIFFSFSSLVKVKRLNVLIKTKNYFILANNEREQWKIESKVSTPLSEDGMLKRTFYTRIENVFHDSICCRLADATSSLTSREDRWHTNILILAIVTLIVQMYEFIDVEKKRFEQKKNIWRNPFLITFGLFTHFIVLKSKSQPFTLI